MQRHIARTTVDLSAYPDMVVIYLGMRINTLAGIKTLAVFFWKVGMVLRDPPEGLLKNETFLYSGRQLGIRQYWSDFESLENWTRTGAHGEWWKLFLRDPAGTGFWHEAYFMRGGMEAVYDNMPTPIGFLHFAPQLPARGPLFSARRRAGRVGNSEHAAPVPEEALYRED
jgi:hypothetical protein